MAESFSSYVKFLRGSETAYKNLKYKKSDTLYFVTTAEGAGKLYLGETLIASGVNDSYVESYLKNLKDVNTLGATNKSLLGYDSSSGKWIPMNPAELIKIDNVIGASEFRDGLAGLVPAPKRGDEKKFLRGDGTWASVQASTTVNADNINGLNEWIAANRNNIQGLYSDSKEEQVKKALESLKGLETQVSANKQSIDDSAKQLNLFVQELQGIKNNNSKMSEDIESIKDSITWQII